MNAAKRKLLAATLTQGRYKWHKLLPAEAGTFHGKRIGISISPLSLKTKDDPPLTRKEVHLIEEILKHLPKLISRAEKAWWSYHGDPEYLDNLAAPHVWLDRQDQQSGQKRKWTFVVEQRNSGYAWHIEFSGIRFKTIWAGS